jgi:hypothetical protein
MHPHAVLQLGHINIGTVAGLFIMTGICREECHVFGQCKHGSAINCLLLQAS